MENNIKKPLGFTKLATIEEKLEQTEKPEVKEIIQGKKTESEKKVEKLISSKMDAIAKYDLKPVTIGVKASLQTKDKIMLETLATINKRTIEEQATHYILEGLRGDKKLAVDYLKNLTE